MERILKRFTLMELLISILMLALGRARTGVLQASLYRKGTSMIFKIAILTSLASVVLRAAPAHEYEGTWVAGDGDAKSLKLIDQAFDSLAVSTEMVSLSLFYKRDWNGMVLSNTAWPGWWIQNTYGPSYGMMPFLEEPYATWMKHAQGLWFRLMGDGNTPDTNGYIGPDGTLVDCSLVFRGGGRDLGFGHIARPHSTNPVNDGKISQSATYYRQGDAGHDTNDWGVGFSAAGLVMECERLLVTRDLNEVKSRMPQLKRVAAYLDGRRDPKTNLLRGGKGSNLLAPSFDGWTDANGQKQHVYLTELSITYCGGLDRLIELCELVGDRTAAQGYRATAANIRAALPALMDDQGSFIMFKDPDGVKHGVYGADKYGYLEATPNHDSVALRVVDDAASKRIIQRMVSIKELAPHDMLITNFPAYDEPGYPTHGLMAYGTWVHGGHWSTCQGRMNIASLRAGEFDHPFKSWDRMGKLMQNFRADAPLGGLGLSPWSGQLGAPYNTVFDCLGVSAGLVRGLFEYEYRADGLRVRPHLPPGITRYVQKKAVVFGQSKIYITVTGTGQVRSAKANGIACTITADGWIDLKNPGQVTAVEIVRGEAAAQGAWKPGRKQPLVIPDNPAFWEIPEDLQNDHHVDLRKLRAFYENMVKANLNKTYEGAMARTALELLLARHERQRMRKAGTLPIPNIEPVPTCNQDAVEDMYLTNALNMAGGLTDHLEGLTIWEGNTPSSEAVTIANQVGLSPPKRTAADTLTGMMIPRNRHKTKVGISQGGGPIAGEVGRTSIFEIAMTAEDIAALAATRGPIKDMAKPCLYTGSPAIGSDLPLKANWTTANELTVEVWIKPAGNGRILDKISIGGSDGFLIDIVGDNQVRTIIGSRSAGVEKDQPSTIQLNQWSHIALVLNQKTKNAILYINGKEVYTLADLPVQTEY
ncbi:MAG: LamG domain-containing protein [Phycisphaerae bacterium]|nr:LamG domain-containing protein [Phycisphaerae bacterium]